MRHDWNHNHNRWTRPEIAFASLCAGILAYFILTAIRS